MFFRKLAMRTGLMGWLIAAFAITSVPQASAAQTVFFSAFGSNGCVNEYGSTYLNAQRVKANQTVTINTIRVLTGTRSTASFSSSNFYLMSNNPSGGTPTAVGAPSTVLATFTADALSGTGANTSATFTGIYTVSAGTIFWIVPGQRASVFPYCYWSSYDTSVFLNGAISIDTSTTNLTTSWHRAFVNGGTNPIGATWSVGGNDGLAWQFSLENNTATPVAATLGTQSGSLKTTFRTVTPLSVSVDTPSKVTYYANGKVISGCRNVLSSAGTATCNWSPSVHGSYRIYAYANPVSTSYVASTTSTINIGVEVRTNKR
jgi:hypothetical protein